MRGRKPNSPTPNGPTDDGDLPVAPAWLSADARAEWDRVLPLLQAGGAIAAADAGLLAAYCGALDMYKQATADIEKNGITFETDKGQLKRNPAVAIASDARNQIVRIERVATGDAPNERRTWLVANVSATTWL